MIRVDQGASGCGVRGALLQSACHVIDVRVQSKFNRLFIFRLFFSVAANRPYSAVLATLNSRLYYLPRSAAGQKYYNKTSLAFYYP